VSRDGPQDGVHSSDSKVFVGWNGDPLVGGRIRLELKVAAFLVGNPISPIAAEHSYKLRAA
jgi:hypothetical protein